MIHTWKKNYEDAMDFSRDMSQVVKKWWRHFQEISRSGSRCKV